MIRQDKTLLKALLISLSFTVLVALSLNMVFAQAVSVKASVCAEHRMHSNSHAQAATVLVANRCD